MKHKTILFLCISFLFWGCSSSKSKVENQQILEKNKRPNVIFILTDDQGSMDVNSLWSKRFGHSKYGLYYRKRNPF